MKITAKNDSLLTYDSLIVTVHSKDGKFSQEVFHGVLRDPKQVESLALDPRVGEDYTITIVGYKGGKIGVNKEVTFTGSASQSKDLPLPPDTVVIDPNLPEIIAPSDTSIAEGDSLRFRVTVRKQWTGKTTLSLKEAITGIFLDTAGRDPGDGYFTWRPTYDQGRSESYAITFVYASSDKKVEKITRIKVINVNRPPTLDPIPDQIVKIGETLNLKVVGADPDHDSLRLTATDLPVGATFSDGNFAWKPSETQAGNYSVTFKAFDNADSDRVTVLITVGNVEPPPPVTVKIVVPSQDTLVNITPITVQYSVNGALLQRKLELKDGKNRIRIDTTILGRSGFDTVLITLDSVPPAPPSVVAVSPVNTRTPTWTWTSGGNGSGVFRYRLDNEDMSGSTMLTATTYTASKDLDVGTHTLYVQERDAAGNWSASGKRAVRIDTTKPPAPPVTVSPSSPTNNPFPTWNWSSTADDFSGTYRYRLDTNEFRAGATETNTPHFTPANALNEGVHTLYVQQQDSAGNWSNSGSAFLSIDLTPPEMPVITSVQASPTNSTRPTWNYSSGGGGSGYYRSKLDDTDLTKGAKVGTLLTFTPDSSLKEGPHTFYVQERDSAGNWSKLASQKLIVDLTPPISPKFSAALNLPLNTVQPTWKWTSGGGGAGIYRTRIDNPDLSQSSDTSINSSYKPPSPLSEGSHILYAQERDSAGNWSAVSSQSLLLSLRATVGGAGFSAGEADYLSLTFNATGTPYLAFADGNNGNKATVMRLVGTTWQIAGPAGFSPGAIEYLSLSFNKAGTPYVAFMDLANGNRATVMRSNGTSWENIGTPGFSAGYASYTNLGFTTTDLPFIAFQSDADTGKALAMNFNGSEWHGYGGGPFSFGDASFLTMAQNSAGVPYVAYRDGVKGGKATVMRLGSAWDSVGVTGFSAGRASALSLGINSGGVPYVVYVDESNGYKLTSMRYNGSTWEGVGTAGFTASRAAIPSLSFVAGGLPCVAFQDRDNQNKMSVMYFDGTSWVNFGPPGLSSGEASSITMAVSPGGVPYVAYRDVPSGNRATVMKLSVEP